MCPLHRDIYDDVIFSFIVRRCRSVHTICFETLGIYRHVKLANDSILVFFAY